MNPLKMFVIFYEDLWKHYLKYSLLIINEIDYLPIEISQYSFKRANPTSSDIKLNATIKKYPDIK